MSHWKFLTAKDAAIGSVAVEGAGDVADTVTEGEGWLFVEAATENGTEAVIIRGGEDDEGGMVVKLPQVKMTTQGWFEF